MSTSTDMHLSVTYEADYGLWTFSNPDGVEPAGPAVIDIGSIGVVVSLTAPTELQRFVIITDDASTEQVHRDVRLLIGPEASRLLLTHDPNNDLDVTVLWRPELRPHWHLVGRLALLARLQRRDNPSPWWAAEAFTLAEPVLDQTEIEGLDNETLRATAEQLLAAPAEGHQALFHRSQAVNGDGALTPVDVLDALARLLAPLDERLSERTSGLAAAVGAPIDEASATRFAAELEKLTDRAPEPERNYLGRPTVRTVKTHAELESLFIDPPQVEKDAKGKLYVCCTVAAADASLALRVLWARAHLEVSPSEVGQVVCLTRFDDPALDRLNGEAPGPDFWTGSDHELRAHLPLRLGLRLSDVVVDVTKTPSRRPATATELTERTAVDLTIRSAKAVRLRTPTADDQTVEAASAHLEAGNAAEHQRLLELRGDNPPDAPLGELDDQGPHRP